MVELGFNVHRTTGAIQTVLAGVGTPSHFDHKDFELLPGVAETSQRTQEVVDKAGRKSEVNRQKIRKGIELRRDMEARMIGNYASIAEAGATPRGTAGVLACLFGLIALLPSFDGNWE